MQTLLAEVPPQNHKRRRRTTYKKAPLKTLMSALSAWQTKNFSYANPSDASLLSLSGSI